MTIHLIKLSVGPESLADLAAWQEKRLKVVPKLTHVTRQTPTFYIGVTSDLIKRIYEHKTDAVPGFTQKYGVHTLVYYECHDDMTSAITREKELKRWNRAPKLVLIEAKNPDWQDLYESIL